MSRLLDDPAAAAEWGRRVGLADPAAAHRTIAALAAHGLTFDLVTAICDRLAGLLPAASDPDRVLVALERFVAAVRSPLSTATLFDRDPESLGVLVAIFSASPFLAETVIADGFRTWDEICVDEYQQYCPPVEER